MVHYINGYAGTEAICCAVRHRESFKARMQDMVEAGLLRLVHNDQRYNWPGGQERYEIETGFGRVSVKGKVNLHTEEKAREDRGKG